MESCDCTSCTCVKLVLIISFEKLLKCKRRAIGITRHWIYIYVSWMYFSCIISHLKNGSLIYISNIPSVTRWCDCSSVINHRKSVHYLLVIQFQLSINNLMVSNRWKVLNSFQLHFICRHYLNWILDYI